MDNVANCDFLATCAFTILVDICHYAYLFRIKLLFESSVAFATFENQSNGSRKVMIKSNNYSHSRREGWGKYSMFDIYPC